MTANGPHQPPLSRRASPHRDESLPPALAAQDGALLRWAMDAAPGSGGLGTGSPSTPRRARSTFTTERKRPQGVRTPLAPLPPVAADPGAPGAPEGESVDAAERAGANAAAAPPSAHLTRRQRRTLAAREIPADASLVDAPAPEQAVPGQAEHEASTPPEPPAPEPPAPQPAVPGSAAPAPQPTRRSSRAAGPPTVGPPAAGPPSAPAQIEEPPAPEPSQTPPPQHVRTRRSARTRTGLGLLVAAVLVVGSAAVTSALTRDVPAEIQVRTTEVSELDAPPEASVTAPLPAPAQSIPAPEVTGAAAFVDLCTDPDFAAALAAGDDAGAIALGGGGEAFRAAVATGAAPCVPLSDPARVWVAVNKLRPLDPIDYAPADLALTSGVRDLSESPLRAGAGAALAAMVTAASGAGAGEIALSSGFRSYGVQQSTYASQVEARGVEGAELVSARPGHSEHQSGLAADVVACAEGGCGGLETFAGTPQAAWVAEHAWEFGWIVRYEDGATGVSGYSPEPWHLRYLGTELAAAYHAGGFHTLEEFFGLPAAAHYPG